jgi:hypothetical protein
MFSVYSGTVTLGFSTPKMCNLCTHLGYLLPMSAPIDWKLTRIWFKFASSVYRLRIFHYIEKSRV